MYNYPFFSFPSFRNYNYYSNNRFPSKTPSATTSPAIVSEKPHKDSFKLRKDSKIKNEPNAIFEIFGIKLYFDDILLISLIFFLYSEGVKDDYLFITLILLLLSWLMFYTFINLATINLLFYYSNN